MTLDPLREQVRSRLISANVTQARFAKKVGVTILSLHKLLNGDPISQPTIYKIRQGLKVTEQEPEAPPGNPHRRLTLSNRQRVLLAYSLTFAPCPSWMNSKEFTELSNLTHAELLCL